jgi:nitrite reductase (NADH) large subunit
MSEVSAVSLNSGSFSAKSVFPAYTEKKNPLPEWVWDVLRGVTVAIWLCLAGVLTFWPDVGLKLLWGVIVPSVPLILVVMPGLWRQICPMAFANQLPRRLGFARGGTLPEVAQTWAYTIAIVVFLVVVGLRQPLFNTVGWMTAALLVGALGAAFAGGVFFKGRSGWCGTFCPLGPIQRTYGQAPVVTVAQTYCATCVGCQKNCYDFNPKAAVFDDMHDEDPRYAGQRRLFMAMIPGVVLAYFGQGQTPAYGYPVYALIFLASTLASVGLYQVFTAMFRFDPYRTAAVFAATALAVFYWYCGPNVLETLFTKLLGMPVSPLALGISRATGFVAALALLVHGAINERLYRAGRAKAEAEAARAVPKAEMFKVTDKGEAQPFLARKGQTLLEAISGAGVAISASCKSGMCGSDAVLVHAGLENLSPPTPDELATLKRLGLEGKGRLACCCRVHGPVTIDRNLNRPAQSEAAPAGAGVKTRGLEPMRLPGLDRAAHLGVERVVIIGNGIAGITAADELRKASAAVAITLVSVEGHYFYNRMAINKIAEGRRTVEDLTLQPHVWYLDNRIDLHLGTRAVAIDRAGHNVSLANGQTLAYDKLILATGARADVPEPAFLARRNCFVLRTADDATALRSYVLDHQARSCAIIGGGVLAVEAAESLRHAGLATTLLVRADRLMNRNIDPESARLLRRYLERLGVEIRTETTCTAFQSSERLESLMLSTGEVLTADLFVAALGAHPDIDLALQCGLETRRGVLVDSLMTTSDPDIHAIGDVAELPGTGNGLWPYGVAQARTAVAAILGRNEGYVEPAVTMRLKSEGIDLRTYGTLDASQPGDEVISAPPFSAIWWRIVIRNGHIIGAVHAGPTGQPSPIWKLVNSTLEIETYREALREGRLDVLDAA